MGLGYSEQLYTARGSQSVGTTQWNLDRLKGDFDFQDYKSTLALKFEKGSFSGFYKKRILWTLDASPWKDGTGFNLVPTCFPMLWSMIDRAADQQEYNLL